MNSLVDSDIQRFVACLVLGYLENQQLQKAYNEFCETSRHLAKEKKGLKYGNKPLDTSVGLVNIIKEYFLFKSRINEFLRLCPLSPIIIQLIDTDDTFQRLDIILKKFKENLHKIDKVPTESTKKRKHEADDIFNVSQSNTSTPETLNPPKRLRKSLTTPFLTLSANKEIKVKTIEKTPFDSRPELKYSSDSDTSTKEDDEVEEEEDDEKVADKSSLTSASPASPTPVVLKANNEQLSEAILEKPGFVDKFVDLINKTRSAKEMEASTSRAAFENGLTHDDLENILSKTENEPSFDEIINDVINNYLTDYPEQESTGQNSSTSEKQSKELENIVESISPTIPIKERLRPRVERKTPYSERKKKINIISNEPYTGIVPAVANIHKLQPEVTEISSSQVVFTLPVYGVEMIPMVANTNSTVFYQNVVQSEIITTKETLVEKKEATPKNTINPNFLESKCKSTPRRKATHIRILDFNQASQDRKLPIIKEFSTPISSGIPAMTPGSAPATIASCNSMMKPEEEKAKEPPEIDENSNSNSITNTPKVVKNRRQRKINVSKPVVEEKLPPIDKEEIEKFSLNDWQNMIKMNKEVALDTRLRMENQKVAERKIKRKKRKTPKKKKVSGKVEKSAAKTKNEQKENDFSTSIEFDEDKPLSSMKFRISSPRKAAKSSPKKKKKATAEELKKKFNAEENESTPAGSEAKEIAATEIEPTKNISSDPPSELNRSDTVQEVATVLTNLSETILAKDNGEKTDIAPDPVKDSEKAPTLDAGLFETPFKSFSDLLETPFKENSLTPLPNTPRFAIPIASETPMPKIFSSSSNPLSLVKICDILTPSFPITPCIKETPLKEGAEVSPTSGGYSSRKTDYSSCSSYYKPDESEDINQNFNLQRRSERTSQSESDVDRPLKIIGSTKKVECPGAIERVKSFTEENKELPQPHYTMMDEGLLSESIVTTASDESSNSSSCTTCSTCSSGSSSDESVMRKLSKEIEDDKDSEWHCDNLEEEKEATASPAVMDEKTGEVRFPLRNWITPKKVEITESEAKIAETNKIKSLLSENDPRKGLSVQEERERHLREMEEKKQRTLERLRSDSEALKSKNHQQKFKKTNIKTFKLPAENLHPIRTGAVSRKEQILSQNLTERSRPTPLKLISTSSSRRKNTTPRKTIALTELPRQASPAKKKKQIPAASNTEKVKVENVNDNAVMPENPVMLYTSLNVSTSFTSSFEEESISTVVEKIVPTVDDGSNTFQRTLIEQGFDKVEARELQNELVDKLENGNDSDESDSESEDDMVLSMCLADALEANAIQLVQSESFPCSIPQISYKLEVKPMILKDADGGKNICLKDSGMIDLFSFDPKEKTSKRNSPKKSKDEMNQINNGKESPMKNGKSKLGKKPTQQEVPKLKEKSQDKPRIKINIKENTSKKQSVKVNSNDISAVLDRVHGK